MINLKTSPLKILEDYIQNNKITDKSWTNISKRLDLTPDFIYQYKDFLSWSYLSTNFKKLEHKKDIDISILVDHFNWGLLSLHGELGDDICQKFIDKIAFKELNSSNLSYDFISKYKDKLNWFFISANYNFPYDFLVKHESYINIGVFMLFNSKHTSLRIKYRYFNRQHLFNYIDILQLPKTAVGNKKIILL